MNNGSNKNMFGIVRAKLADAAAAKLDAVAKRHGCRFVHAGSIPGNTTRGWFEGDTVGFGASAERDAVLADVRDSHHALAAHLGFVKGD